MMMKGPIRQLTPVAAQRVRLRLPAGRKAAHAQLLVSGKKADVRFAAGVAELTVPSILDHEVVVL